MSLSPASQIQTAHNSVGYSDLSLVLTGYAGHEEQVLRLRNANRDTVKTREYMDWRYRQLSDMPPPCIAWLMSAAGEPVGMAAAIFRPFWVSGVVSPVAVIGDISLDERLRGKGFGQQLLAGLSRHLAQDVVGGRAFVIPTEAARRSLDSIGWRTVGQLIPYVCPINPAMKLTKFVGGEILAAGLGWPVRSMLSLAARLHVRRGFAIEIVDKFDERFDELWAQVPKADWILGDRGRASLTWRYHDHPTYRFRVAQLIRGSELRGFVVFETEQAESEWTIQDMVVADQADLPCLLALFLVHCLKRSDVVVVRLTLNNRHPYARGLWRLGFIAQAPQTVFQVLEPSPPLPGFAGQWSLTAGDKDI